MEMVCHYDVLEVPRDANDDQIKKSYRKLAKKFHPDRNLSNVEESTEIFKVIQKAYSILSDPKERERYDNCEGNFVIIHNYENELNEWDIYRRTHNHYHPNNYRFHFPQKFDPNRPFKYVKRINLQDFFNKTDWFQGYSDNIDGFYTIVRKLFDKLSMEHGYKPGKCASFGTSKSDYENELVQFYKTWERFYINTGLFDSICAAYARAREIIAFVKFIKGIDKRVQKYNELHPIEEKMYISKRDPNVKVRKSGGRAGTYSGVKSEFYTYSGSSNLILQEIGDDYDDDDYLDEEYDESFD